MTTSEAKRLSKSSDPAVRETAKRVLAYAQRQKAMRKSRRSRAPGPTKAERRAAHGALTAVLRAQVWGRCGGKCEVSGVELGAAWEMHHVQGRGERRSAQRLGNVLAVSWDVHRLIHRGDLDTLRAVAACPVLDAEGRKAAEYRIAKVEEARRASGGTP